LISDLITFVREDGGFCEVGAEAEEAAGHRTPNVMDFKI
jgi:hypothetical protein